MKKLEKWIELSALTKKLVAEERELRRELVEELVGSEATFTESRNKVAADGRNLMIATVLNRKFDEPALASIWSDLTEAEREVIKLKPHLSIAHYRKLPETSILHQAIIVSPGMPTIEVKE